jgi:cell wall-associated NlpC family hydrolase
VDSPESVWFLVAFFLLTGAAITVSGCGPTSPRFRSGEPRPSVVSGRTESARSGKDSVQSMPEDVETSLEGKEEVLSGSRTFKSEKNSSISNLDRAKMMREISKMMGVSYKLGGGDENGIDCSAYTMIVYKNSMGKLLPRSSAEQFRIGIPVHSEDLKFGDLLFFDTTGQPASHVGIYLGDDLFAHASVSLGVTISSLESYYFKQRYNGARRVIE